MELNRKNPPTIKDGQRVRSFDFPERFSSTTGDFACFIEGTVVGIGDFLGLGHNQYKLKIERRIVRGAEHSLPDTEFVYPPVNGLDQMMSDYPTHGVVPVESTEEALKAQLKSQIENTLDHCGSWRREAQEFCTENRIPFNQEVENFCADVVISYGGGWR